ncbi:PAS domain S-box protein [uncultured Marinobacter sp.]|uniref:PAS domain S-box protein n=1 Tax=uncultured Marinobacter sp. TaxID=187379 RepID=UPI002636CBA2|nr:PAS domain S-box protein [uncultured Marinobacter sp.]
MAERQLTFWFCLTLALSISLAAIGTIILFDAATLQNGAVGRITLEPGGGLMAIAISIALFAVLFGLRIVASVTSVGTILAAFFFTALPHLPLTTASHPFLDRFYIGPAVFTVIFAVAISVLSAIHLTRGWLAGLIAAPLVMVIGFLSLLSYWYPQLAPMSLGSIPEATIVVSPLAILASLALPFLFHFDKSKVPLFSRGVVLVGVLGITITTMIWHIMRLHTSESIQQRAETLAIQVQDAANSAVDIRLTLLQRLAERFRLVESQPSDGHWRQEVTSYFRDFPELRLISILDPTMRPEKTEARLPDDRIWIDGFLNEPQNRTWLGHVTATRVTHLSPPKKAGPGGGWYSVIAAPSDRPQNRSWLIIATINLNDVFSELQQRKGALELLVKYSGQIIFDSTGGERPESIQPLAALDLYPHHDSKWQIEVFPTSNILQGNDFYLPPLILFTGLGLSFLMMLSHFFWRESVHHSQRLSALNDTLNRHLKKERNLRHTHERIMQFSREILCSVSHEGVFTAVSPACETVLGYSPQELVGTRYDQLLLPEDKASATDEISRLVTGENERTRDLKTRLRHKNGQVVTVAWTAEWSQEDNALFCVGRDVSNELAAEVLSHEREQFFSLSPDMFCIVDLNNNFFELNQSFVKTLGYERNELLGTSYLELVHKDDEEDVKKAVRSLVAGNIVNDLYIRVLHRNGTARWIQINAILSTDEMIYAVARDITETQAIQEKLKESEALLRIAGHLAQVGGWIVDISSGKTLWSDAVCDIHEVPRGQVPDIEEAIRYYIPEHQQRIREAVELCIETGFPYDEELELRTAKGRLRWVRTIGHAVKDAKGNIVRLQGAFQDITENRQATEQLRRYAERQSTIFESITDAFFTLDKDWRFIYVNKRSEEILRRSREELLGRTLWEWFPEAIGSEFDDQYRYAMEKGESVAFEAYYPPLREWFEVSAYPSEEGLSVYYRSITERKEAQEKLETTLKELERSNRELQDFAFVASHDLQEPLRKIQAFSDRLISTSDRLTTQDLDYLKRMQSAAMRMQALILDLLSYSRVTSKAKPFVNCDTNKILQGVLDDMEATIARENAVLETSRLPPIHGDPTQIRQVLQNLLSNAVKFHPKDRPPRILVYPENKAQDGWTLVVQDNGIGFDPKYADKLFHPFQRLHQKHEYDGTGIGMAIVKKILDRHNASIEVESAPNAGTTFRIRFVANNKEVSPQDG